MLTIIIFLLVTLSTGHASLKFALCRKVNERPGICPSYDRTCMTPYPLRISHHKSFKCVCDTDCKKYYKCCEDSCYSHGICKRVIFNPPVTTINPVGRFFSPIIPRSATMKHMCQAQHPGLCPPYSIIHPTPLPKYISWNKPYRCKCDSECKVNYKCCEDSYFEHGVCKPAVRIPKKKVPSDDEDLEYSGSGYDINMNEHYSGSGDLSGDFSGEIFSGSGHESSYIDSEILSTRIPITIYNSDDEDFEFSGFDDTINQYSGSGDFSGDKEYERFSGSGHDLIHIDDERLTTRIPTTIDFNDDEDFQSSGFDETIMYNYSGSGAGDFSGESESEQFSGSGYELLDNDEFSGKEVKHFVDDKIHVHKKFVDNLNSKFKNTEKPAENNNDIIESDDMYFAEPDNSDITHDTETQIHPTNKYTDEHQQNSADNSNELKNTNKYKHGDDF